MAGSLDARAVLGHVRGALVAFTAFSALVLGFPGLDTVGPEWLADDAARAKMRAHPGGFVVVAVADVNRTLRHPVVKLLTPLQRPLRIAQSWDLYGGGPNRLRRMEIDVDGVLRYRSQDDDHAWLWSLLHYRKVRPVVVATCDDGSPNARHLVAMIADRAQRDFPGAQRVEVRCTSSAWPGDGEARVTDTWTTAAPDWTVTP